ncbi:MAG: phospholipase [Terriglobia bacterium]|nr:MAG: phospholipase [Terriglobia bacterium]
MAGILVSCPVTAGLLFAQTYPPGPQTITFISSVDGSEQPYALYLPRPFDLRKRYPLLISLHAEESNHRLNLIQLFGQTNRFGDAARIPLASFHPVRDVEMIVASPLARGTMGYRGIAERDVYDVLADVKRRFQVDDARVYLTGVSMGGGGALWLALSRPDIWAAVAPVCPAPLRAIDVLAPNALNLPIRLFHGNQDPVSPVAVSRLWQRRFLDLGVPADYIEYPAVRHNAWDYAYKDGALFDWFLQFQRNRFPERVRFVTDSHRYDSAYWVRIDSLTPGVLASIDARQTGGAELRVETQNIDGFTLSLDHPLSAVTIDGALFRFKAVSAPLSFRKLAGRWTPGRLPLTGKRSGLEGPIAEAVSNRHIYVYGTADSPVPEELNFRRAQAESAAHWDNLISFPVKADSAVTQQDLDTSDLVLFGTSQTNSLIARFVGRLPLALEPGAADYGLLFVADLGNHYALVSSGLPWWTGFDEASRQTDRYTPVTFAELSTFGDFIVFKSSLANVVAEGRFDPNWNVPAYLRAKLTSSGAVTVR